VCGRGTKHAQYDQNGGHDEQGDRLLSFTFVNIDTYVIIVTTYTLFRGPR
jgi:hypothetical protein